MDALPERDPAAVGDPGLVQRGHRLVHTVLGRRLDLERLQRLRRRGHGGSKCRKES